MEPRTWSLLAAPLLAAAVAAFLLGRFCDPRSRFHWLDRPNERSLHSAPVPRSGGLAILTGVTAGWLLASMPMPSVMAAALVLGAVSLVDDLRHLPALLRLGAHLLAALGIVAHVGPAGAWGAGAVIAIAWMSNLYNFMDGADGLAGGMAVFGFSAYGAAAILSGNGDIAALSFCIAAAAAVFLVFNWHPARIFLGDAGSIPLGFLAASLGLAGVLSRAWPAWFPLLVFSPFIADATWTLGRRLLRGERVWQAHREHYYQRMVRMGYGHAGMSLRWYAMMAAVCTTALVALSAPRHFQYISLILWLLAFAALGIVIDRRWARFRGASLGANDAHVEQQ